MTRCIAYLRENGFAGRPGWLHDYRGDNTDMIEAEGLSKRYGDTLAVDNLSCSVAPGKITGFLGPNGAGKTTTMRMILGLDRPTAGRVTVDGKPFDQADQPMRRGGAPLDARGGEGGRAPGAEARGAPASAPGFPRPAWASAGGSWPRSSVARRSSCSTSRSTGWT